MRKQLAAAAALLTLSQAVHARDAEGFVDFYFIPDAKIEVTIPGFGSGDDSGDGFGFRGMVPAGGIAVTGEYQSTGYDDSGIDFDQLRLGIGLVNETTSGLLVEYVDADLDGSNADGFAGHLRAAGRNLYAQVGYVMLEDDFEETSGVEFLVGVTLGGDRGPLSGFIDYRRTMLEGDESNVEYEFSDIRIGARLKF
jgi:hypothetical protein